MGNSKVGHNKRLWIVSIIIAFCSALFYIYFQRPLGLSNGYAFISALISNNTMELAAARVIFWLNIGIITGAIIGAWHRGQLGKWFSFGKKIRWSQLIIAFLGGILMGYGAKIGNTCLLGALLGGIPSGSLQGWAFLVFLTPGVAIGILILKGVNKLSYASKKSVDPGAPQI